MVTVMEQLAPGVAMLPLASLMPGLPTARAAPVLSVSVPPQVLVTDIDERLIWPGVVGNTSVNDMADNAPDTLLFVMVKVRFDVPPAITGFDANVFVNEGSRFIVRDAPAVPPVPPSREVTARVLLL